MCLLVEYSIVPGKAPEQIDALKSFVAALKELGDSGFDYTSYETNEVNSQMKRKFFNKILNCMELNYEPQLPPPEPRRTA